MKDDPIRTALDNIAPAPGAKERMLQHISEKSEKPPKKKKSALLWLALPAACLALVLMLHPGTRPQERPRPVMTGNPVVQMQTLSELAPAGALPVLPARAQITGCALVSGQVGRVEFTLDGISYRCLFSEHRTDDFSFVDGGQTETVCLQESPQILLHRLDGRIWKAELVLEQGRMYLINEAGADRAQMEALALSLAPA